MTYNVPTAEDLSTILQSAPENTSDTPHTININVVTQADVDAGTIKKTLRNNSTKYVSLNILSASDVTNASYMFLSCSSLASVDVSAMTAVTNASYMFSGCHNLTSADVSNMTSVTDASSMFQDCGSLTSVDVSGLSSVTNATNMFRFCDSLEKITGWAIPPSALMENTFNGCASLSKIVVAGAVPLPSDTTTWKLCHVNQAENDVLSMDIHSLDGTTVRHASDIDISQNNKATLYGRVDEIYLGSHGSSIKLGTMIENMIKGQHQLALQSEHNVVDATAGNNIIVASNDILIENGKITAQKVYGAVWNE